ncbi:MAG: peptidoglycan bridge formation glycyltransferase FemA/FemB family protein [Candidatus Gottesmanbacteria bacterium]
MTDLRQSENYAQYMEKLGWKVEKLRIANSELQIFIKKIPLLPFSIIKIQRPEKIDFDQLDRIAKKYHGLFIKIEPTSDTDPQLLITNGYKLGHSPLLPTKTLQLDLTPSLDQILNQIAKETRYEIRKAEENQLKIIVYSEGRQATIFDNPATYADNCSFDAKQCTRANDNKFGKPMRGENNIDNFISLWQKNAWSRGFWIPIKQEIKSIYEAFGKNAYLVLANSELRIKNYELLAGAMIIIHDKVAYYFHAASSPEGRNLSAPSLIIWQAIKLAKEKGCQVFDFEGIYDERFPIKSWQGFTHFKKGFGGKEIEYPGTFTKFYNPLYAMR